MRKRRNHKCFIANLVSLPCITYAEMWALRRKGLAHKEPRLKPYLGAKGCSNARGATRLTVWAHASVWEYEVEENKARRYCLAGAGVLALYGKLRDNPC